MREIKYQAYVKSIGECFPVEYLHIVSKEAEVRINNEPITGLYSYSKDHEEIILRQFTGLHDKNGNEIYEGDIVKVRQADRFEQTHFGDNIPLGSYTEMLEPYIKEWNQVITFKDGMFGLDKSDDDWFTPLIWLIEEFQVEEYELCNIFRGRENDWEEDLDYLLQEYSLSSAEELIKYLGIEVIGNQFENHELLEQTS